MAWRKVTDAQWEKVQEQLPVRKKPWRKKDRKGGRPPLDDRKCFEGILWILWTGAQWSELPPRYGSKSAVHRRLLKWTDDGTLERIWRAFLAQLQDKDHIRWNECFVDGTFASAKKGGFWSAKPSEARERSLWYWLMARVLRSDFTWTRRPRRKSGSSSRRSRRSGSPVLTSVVVLDNDPSD